MRNLNENCSKCNLRSLKNKIKSVKILSLIKSDLLFYTYCMQNIRNIKIKFKYFLLVNEIIQIKRKVYNRKGVYAKIILNIIYLMKRANYFT